MGHMFCLKQIPGFAIALKHTSSFPVSLVLLWGVHEFWVEIQECKALSLPKICNSTVSANSVLCSSSTDCILLWTSHNTFVADRRTNWWVISVVHYLGNDRISSHKTFIYHAKQMHWHKMLQQTHSVTMQCHLLFVFFFISVTLHFLNSSWLRMVTSPKIILADNHDIDCVYTMLVKLCFYDISIQSILHYIMHTQEYSWHKWSQFWAIFYTC